MTSDECGSAPVDGVGGLEVLVVQTGTANIGSVTAALRKIGARPRVVTTPDEIPSASHVVVPGVGTFGASMLTLNNSGCADVVKQRVDAGLPTLFVCVGLQLLGTSSDESPGEQGLGVVRQSLTRFPDNVRVPQHGWNYVAAPSGSRFVVPGFAYFSNSYKFAATDLPQGWTVSVSTYGVPFIAAIERGGVLACQFHPELSGAWGLALLRRWCTVDPASPVSPDATFVAEAPRHSLKTNRIIPCLDVAGGKIVKGIKFQDLKEAGDPAPRAALYEQHGADELVVLDISATVEARKTRLDTVRKIREVLSIPVTVGGGVSVVDDAQSLLQAGADKVAVNTAAVRNPHILTEMADRFGRQCTVLSLDASVVPGTEDAPRWEVVVSAGRERTGMDAVGWAVEAERRGAGEILLTSWDRDGTKSGYDVGLIAAIAAAVKIPIIASGGAATAEHMVHGLRSGADAVLAASIFHYEEYTVGSLKHELHTNDIVVRL